MRQKGDNNGKSLQLTTAVLK